MLIKLLSRMPMNHLKHSMLLTPRAAVAGMRHMSQNNKRPKAVIFDMGGVILPAPMRAFNDFEAEVGVPTGLVVKVIIENSPTGAWQRLEKGELTLSEFIPLFSEECSRKADKPIDTSSLMSFFHQKMALSRPEFVEAIQCIRAEGIKTALLTNNWKVSHTESFAPVDKSLFDVVTESCLVGSRKPERTIYETCLSQLDVAPQDAVFLDDIGRNLKAAEALGIRTIKVDVKEIPKAVEELEREVGFEVRGFAPGTIAVPERLRLPHRDKLSKYLSLILQARSEEEPTIRCFKHGQSNPTYFITYAGKKVVLRKKPPGKLLPSAHAVDREFKVMSALGQKGVPMPKMIHFCDDTELLGTEFYVMEYVPGRIFKNPLIPGMDPVERQQIYAAMNDVLAKIHTTDIKEAKLEDYGKQGNYMKRNFGRWMKQYEASKTHDIPAMEKLGAWLLERIPSNEACTVVHGDFRLDNLIFHPSRPEVLAVLDWELSTLGDPLSDLATNCITYIFPEGISILPGFGALNFEEHGIPTLKEYIAQYCRRVGLTGINNFDFYLAFVCFRVAAILQGVYKRALKGQASSTDAETVGLLAGAIADLGWQVASRSSLKPTSGSGSQSPPVGDGKGQPGQKEKFGLLPVSVSALSPKAQEYYARVKTFIKDHVMPLEQELIDRHDSPEKWTISPKIEELKVKAKAEGLWNLFVPHELDPEMKYGVGLTNVEYSFICEEMGKTLFAPEVFNCSAPDTGNMEVLLRYGSDEQKAVWLKPLLEGKIRSCFGMTEPQVASSDATNIESSIVREGDKYIINGRKWWTSGAMDPRCKVCIFMGKTDTGAARHLQQSMILVPMDAPGVKIVRPLSVFGYQDPPAGHAEVLFENVMVPASNILLGEGRGFEIAQGRLGPGRIHHCMRIIGYSERALDLMIQRVQNRVAFGKPLAAQGTIQQDIAKSRCEIEQTRLLVLKASHMMDTVGNKVAAPEISMIKVIAPKMGQKVLDRAIQAHGGAGLSSDFPLGGMFTWARVIRIADGPDEVHLQSLARMEFKKNQKSKL